MMNQQSLHDWVPCELHTHTIHSDAQHTLREMAEAARLLGLQCIALTDHNTMSGLVDKEEVEQAADIRIIEGMELTTFYGHILALGMDGCAFIEWRDLGPGDAEKAANRIHEAGGIVGAAHPFLPADPLAIGCRWEYTVNDWTQIDYLEVWNGTSPSMKYYNRKAMALWDGLLNRGVRMPAICGRDWHVSRVTEQQAPEVVAANYFQLDQKKASWKDDILQAIRAGRISVSMGEVPDLRVSLMAGGESFGMGEVCRIGKNDQIRFEISLLPSKIRQEQAAPSERIQIISNKGIIFHDELNKQTDPYVTIVPSEGLSWARAELYGNLEKTEVLIGFTNCVYFEH